MGRIFSLCAIAIFCAACSSGRYSPFPFEAGDKSAIITVLDRDHVDAFAVFPGGGIPLELPAETEIDALVYSRSLEEMRLTPGMLEPASDGQPHRALPGGATRMFRLEEEPRENGWQPIDRVADAIVAFRIADLDEEGCLVRGCFSSAAPDLAGERSCEIPCGPRARIAEVVPPAPVVPPEAPRIDCAAPSTWPPLCNSPPPIERLNCPLGQADFGSGCENIGTCDQNFPASPPVGSRFVDADAPSEGDGSQVSPHKSLAAAFAQSAPGTTVFARGVFSEVVMVPDGVTLHGLCATETQISTVPITVYALAGSATIENLTLISENAGVIVRGTPGSGVQLTLNGVTIRSPYGAVGVELAALIADHLVVENSGTASPGEALTSIESRIDLRSYASDSFNMGLRIISSTATIERAVITGRADPEAAHYGIMFQGARATVKSVRVHDQLYHAFYAERSRIEFEDVTTDGNAQMLWSRMSELSLRRLLTRNNSYRAIGGDTSKIRVEDYVLEGHSGVDVTLDEVAFSRGRLDLDIAQIILIGSSGTMSDFSGEIAAVDYAFQITNSTVAISRGSLKTQHFGMAFDRSRAQLEDLRLERVPSLSARPTIDIERNSIVRADRLALIDPPLEGILIVSAELKVTDLSISVAPRIENESAAVRASHSRVEIERAAIESNNDAVIAQDSTSTITDLFVTNELSRDRLVNAVTVFEGQMRGERWRDQGTGDTGVGARNARLSLEDIEIGRRAIGFQLLDRANIGVERATVAARDGIVADDRSRCVGSDVQIRRLPASGDASIIMRADAASTVELSRFSMESTDGATGVQLQRGNSIRLRQGAIRGYQAAIHLPDVSEPLRTILDDVDVTANDLIVTYP